MKYSKRTAASSRDRNKRKIKEIKKDYKTSLMSVPNLGAWEPYLPKTKETLKIYATG